MPKRATATRGSTTKAATKPAVTKKPKVAKGSGADALEALVEHILDGFTAKTAARGVRVGAHEPELVKALGKPTTVHRDQDMGGRRVTELRWERDIEVAGIAVNESLGISWTTKPDPRGVTSISLMVSSDDSAAKTLRDAFAAIKTRLGALYKKGENKSTFRAPSLGGTTGFVAVFYAPREGAPWLMVNAGVLE